MNWIEYFFLAALAAGLWGVARQAVALRADVAEITRDLNAERQHVKQAETQVESHAGQIARLAARVRTLEAPASFVGRWGTHEGKDGRRRRVEIVHATMGADGAPASFRVTLYQDGRPPITYDIAAAQVELEPRP